MSTLVVVVGFGLLPAAVTPGWRAPVRILPLQLPRARLLAPPLMCDMNALDWDAYHMRELEMEWLMPYEGEFGNRLKDGLSRIPRNAPLLELGCGTSSLARSLHDDLGFRNITCIDISRQAIMAAQKDATALAGVRFEYGDARQMSFEKESFGACIDKGTLDAICCGEGFDYEARRVTMEVFRVLAPGGVWLVLSLMPPSVMLPLIHSQHTNDWMVSYDKVDKYHLYCARRSRKGAMLTRWHWHPVEGGWRSRVRCRV